MSVRALAFCVSVEHAEFMARHNLPEDAASLWLQLRWLPEAVSNAGGHASKQS
jgi:hypothetical protein